MDRATLMMAMAAMADRKAVASEVALRLGLTTTTLYAYVNGDGTPKSGGSGTARRHSPCRRRGAAMKVTTTNLRLPTGTTHKFAYDRRLSLGTIVHKERL
jgi:hypothetical protein